MKHLKKFEIFERFSNILNESKSSTSKEKISKMSKDELKKSIWYIKSTRRIPW